MTKINNIRFQKISAFSEPVFIASEKSDKEAYDMICSFHRQLQEQKSSGFLPIYSDSMLKFATIRFKPYTQVKLIQNAVYNIDFTVRKSTTGEGRSQIKCYINKIKQVADPLPPAGEVVELKF